MTEPHAPCPLAFVVDAVTVYEDRADVVRVADVDVDAGAHAWRFEHLSPLIDEDRLVCTVEGDAHVDDVHVERVYVDPTADKVAERRLARAEERTRLAAALRDLADAHKAAQGALTALTANLGAWRTSAERQLGRGVNVDVDAAFATFQAAHLAAVAEVAEKKARHDEVLRQHEAIALEDRRPPPMLTQRVCHVTVRVAAHSKGRVRVRLATVVPCAAWRPSHEAALTREAPTSSTGMVQWRTQAAVWNATGEAWRGARLVLSTARPSLGAALPTLEVDRLRLRTKTAEEKKTIRVEHRTEAVPQSANKGAAPGVDDGGEARVFAVAAADVDDDGRPRQFPLTSWSAPCTLAQVAVPEQSRVVFLRASLKNASATPLLAGPVTLKEGSAWCGVGDVLFCGPGDDLDLSFGSNDRVGVVFRKHVAIDKKLVGKDIKNFVQEATVTSTSTSTEALTLLLRLPVSELAQVKVVQAPHHSTVGAVVADAHGIVRLPVTLPPGGEHKLALAFSFDAHSDVVLPDPWT
jgi:uncharacterized protein (TIGR02231 family)